MAASAAAAAGGAATVNMEMELQQQPYRKDARRTSEKMRPSKKDFQPLDQHEVEENEDPIHGKTRGHAQMLAQMTKKVVLEWLKRTFKRQ